MLTGTRHHWVAFLGQSTRPARAAVDPNPVVAFVVGLFPSPAMTRDRVLAVPRTPSWQERQRQLTKPTLSPVPRIRCSRAK